MKVNTWRSISRNWELYLLMLIPLAFLILFSYVPMYGIQIAFREFRPLDGITGSQWVGLRHFEHFVTGHMFSRVMINTIALSIYLVVASFPIPIIFAILIHYIPLPRFRKIVQTISYAPNFISVVVMSGLIILFLGERSGMVNDVIELFGGSRTNFLGIPEMFRSVFVWTDVWQFMGFSSIIYIAALAGVNPELHEAAMVDGASILSRVRHIDLPSIAPTIVILFILRVGQLLSIGFEKVLLLQNPMNLSASEIISTYVYKVGILSPLGEFSYAAAVGLFTSVINVILLVSVNAFAKKVGETSLW